MVRSRSIIWAAQMFRQPSLARSVLSRSLAMAASFLSREASLLSFSLSTAAFPPLPISIHHLSYFVNYDIH